VLYDGRSLLIGVHAFDATPQGIVATERRRDSDRLLDEDNFELIVDTSSAARGWRESRAVTMSACSTSRPTARSASRAITSSSAATARMS